MSDQIDDLRLLTVMVVAMTRRLAAMEQRPAYN
jgi:hypothetical protein